MDYLPVSCELNEGNTVTFDIPWTEAADFDETWQTYVLFQTLIGK